MQQIYDKTMKILFIANQARSTYIFWSVLMQNIQQLGHNVVCCVPAENDQQYINELRAQGVRVIMYPLQRKGINPLYDIKSFIALYNIARTEKAHKIFTSTIKPIIYGNIAAKLGGNGQIFSCITGLGFSFEPTDNILKKLFNKLVTWLYKIALGRTKCVFFQNMHDREIFLQENIISKHTKTALCNGTGVNIKHFYFHEHFPTRPTFLLVARLLKAKGIEDFAKAGAIIKQKYPQACFQVLGPEEQGYGSLNLSQVLAWQNSGHITYLGDAHDVRPFLTEASVVVLPSLREGLSCALMEAMSMGRPVVASDVPGCRELIINNKNGILVPPQNPVALAHALEQFILHPQNIASMGLAGRRMVEEHFDATYVAKQLLQHMKIVE